MQTQKNILDILEFVDNIFRRKRMIWNITGGRSNTSKIESLFLQLLSKGTFDSINDKNSEVLATDILKVGLSPSKKILCYLLYRKHFKDHGKCFLFDLKSSFRSQDI